MSELVAAVATIAAAISIVGGAIATALAQSAIGSAGLGAAAEKPEIAGTALLYLVIPETIIIFSFVISILLLLWFGRAH